MIIVPAANSTHAKIAAAALPVDTIIPSPRKNIFFENHPKRVSTLSRVRESEGSRECACTIERGESSFSSKAIYQGLLEWFSSAASAAKKWECSQRPAKMPSCLLLLTLSCRGIELTCRFKSTRLFYNCILKNKAPVGPSCTSTVLIFFKCKNK